MQCTIHTTLTSILDSIGREHSLLEVKDAALAVGVTPWWIRQLIAKGDLRAINIGGPEKAARWRIDPQDLNAWMRNRENRPRDFAVSLHLGQLPRPQGPGRHSPTTV